MLGTGVREEPDRIGRGGAEKKEVVVIPAIMERTSIYTGLTLRAL